MLCVALHDVAPSTWPQCQALLRLIDDCGDVRVTLLVVPEYHGHADIEHNAAFRSGIAARLARGDEVALHGLSHRDEAPASLIPTDWVRRRLLTAGEGEFAALTQAQASARIERGIEWMHRLRWPIHGFVAPAWLMSAGTQRALRGSGLDYTTTHTALLDLRAGGRVLAPCLTASPRSAWRRAASRWWLRQGAVWTRGATLLRLGLHPADAAHASLTAHWRKLIVELCATRESVTKWQAFDRFAQASLLQ